MYDFLPYVEYWRYRTNTCVEETADDRYDSITSINQMKYDFAKVGRNPWLIQDMRELSQHGRAVTIAVDVRMYQLMKGEVSAIREDIDSGESTGSVLAHRVFRGHQNRDLHERIRNERAERSVQEREDHRRDGERFCKRESGHESRESRE